jgi:hypothetical protein
MTSCKVCGKELTGMQLLYCSSACKTKCWHWEHDWSKRKRQTRVERLRAKFGLFQEGVHE